MEMYSLMSACASEFLRVFVQTIRLIWGLFSQSWDHVGAVAEGLFEERGPLSCRFNSKLSFKAPSSCVSWKINSRLSSCSGGDFFARLAVLSRAGCLLDFTQQQKKQPSQIKTLMCSSQSGYCCRVIKIDWRERNVTWHDDFNYWFTHRGNRPFCFSSFLVTM